MKKNQSFLALTCGDAYGSYFEFEGLLGCTFPISKLPNVPIEKRVTDDTKMARILLVHYKKYGTLKRDILLNSYKYWAKREGQGDGIGRHTYNILVQNQKNKDSQGNGALMRVIPFGVELIKDGYSFEDAVAMMNTDSSLTHENETIFMANRLCLDLALHGVKILDKKEYVQILQRLLFGTNAWVIHFLYIVIEALKKKLSFLNGFKYIVSAGGDTDTNCAIFGAIKGCKHDIRDELDIKQFIEY